MAANFNFVIDSSFKPFTFEDRLKPLALYKQAYDEVENAYLDLSDKSDKFKYLSNTLPEGSKARQIYENYAEQLKLQAEDLARNGLTMGNRRALMGLRRRYQGEIGRLEEADALRKSQIESQMKALAENPTMIFSRRADMTSLDDYLDNPTLSYEQYNGALLTKQVGDAAKMIAKELRDGIKTGRLDGFTKTWAEQYGISADEVFKAINDPTNPSSSKVLNTLVDGVVASSKIPTWGNREAVATAYDYARQGLWNAIGETKIHAFEDFGSRENYKATLDIAKERQKAIDKQTDAAAVKWPAINPKNIYSRKEKPIDGYDATRSTEFEYPMTSTQRKDMKDLILAANRGRELEEVDFDDKSSRFVPTGDTLSLDKLNNDKYSIVFTRISPYGNSIFIRDDKGEVKRYRLPNDLNPTAELNRDNALRNAAILQQAISSRMYTDNNGNTHEMSQSESEKAIARYRMELSNAYTFHSQLMLSNKTADQEFNPYPY